MTAEPDTIVLALLRRIDGKVDRLIDDVNDLKARTSAVGTQLAGVHRRIERLQLGALRILRRSDLADAPH